MKKRFFLWLARKGTKPTTWAVLLVMISSILGFELTVEQNAAIAQALAPIVGALLIFAKESGEEDQESIDKARVAAEKRANERSDA